MLLGAAPDFDGVPLDTKAIAQARLNIDNKERSSLFPWNGQFSPQLVEILLRTYGTGCVLDPFLGSGTVLGEAGRLGHPAFGSEVNPAAFKMARVYTFINIQPGSRRDTIGEVTETLHDALPNEPNLFSLSGSADSTIEETLIRAAAQAESTCRVLLEALIVLLDFGERDLTIELVLKAWHKLRDSVLALPFSEARVDLSNCDARDLPDWQATTVITSPPYVNVFNYHQHYRLSAEALGWNLLQVAKSEIGSNRKHRGNRFLTVIQYCLDMADVLRELHRVTKADARIIFVVGRESNVRKTRFFNGQIIARLATRSAGFKLEMRQERVFRNRFGEMIYEDILHFIKTSEDMLTPPCAIASDILTSALDRAPAESMDDLKSAIDDLEEVRPSPIYCPDSAFSSPRKTKETV